MLWLAKNFVDKKDDVVIRSRGFTKNQRNKQLSILYGTDKKSMIRDSVSTTKRPQE